MSHEEIFGTAGMINFVAALSHVRNGYGDTKFPAATEWRDVNFRCTEAKPRDFFVRLINEAVEHGFLDDAKAIESCELDEGIALFMEMTWSGDRLLRCSVQIVAALGQDLETLYVDDECDGVYYRFDYAINERGQLFDHPFPHIHSVPDGAPRFPFAITKEVFPPLTFIEFAMINHSYESWRDWILFVYASRNPGDVPENENTPEEFFESFKDELKWLSIDESKRNRFLKLLKEASKEALKAISGDLPKIDSDHLMLNYWQDF